MTAFDFDLFVIGAGSGGVRAAASRPATARASRSPRSATSAAPASTSAACRRSCSSTPRITREDFARRGRLRLERRRAALRLAAAARQQGSRDRAPERHLPQICSKGAASQLIEGRARVRRPAHGRDRRAALTARHILIATGGLALRAGHPRARARDHLERGLRPRRAAAAHAWWSAAATSRSSSPGIFTASAWPLTLCLSRRAVPARLRPRRARDASPRRCRRRASTCASARAVECASRRRATAPRGHAARRHAHRDRPGAVRDRPPPDHAGPRPGERGRGAARGRLRWWSTSTTRPPCPRSTRSAT